MEILHGSIKFCLTQNKLFKYEVLRTDTFQQRSSHFVASKRHYN